MVSLVEASSDDASSLASSVGFTSAGASSLVFLAGASSLFSLVEASSADAFSLASSVGFTSAGASSLVSLLEASSDDASSLASSVGLPKDRPCIDSSSMRFNA